MNFQSGKTQAIDLDELQVETANRPSEYKERDEFEPEKWHDDPWASTEESRKRRRWAEDDKWAGDDEESRQQQTAERWDVEEDALKAGWKAPKRGDQLEANEGWDDWGNFGGAPKQLDEETESKEFGGYRRVQAASQYAVADNSNYVDGRQNRDDLYRQKETFGTAGLKERRGDPYAQQPSVDLEAMPEMKPVDEWIPDTPNALSKDSAPEQVPEDDVKAAKLSNVQAGDDIPGVTRASVIVFQIPDPQTNIQADPVICELKKTVTTFGRAEDNMVVINDQYTSRHHISINYVSGKFEMVAISQDNLTQVNSYPAVHVILKNEDQIEIGATRIKFIVGPISDAHMQMTAPKNGVPMHIGMPPERISSPRTTRKNLYILIAIVSTIILIMIIGVIIMLVGKSHDKAQPKVAEISQSAQDDADDKNKGEEDNNDSDDAESDQAADAVELADEDKTVVESLSEALAQGAGEQFGTNSTISGSRVRISVKTTPEGAKIFNADGSFRGTTPYEIEEVVANNREETWTIRYDDYKEVTETINLKDGVSLDLTLEPEVVEAPVVEEPKPAPKKPAAKKAPAKKKPANKNKTTSGGKKGARRILL